MKSVFIVGLPRSLTSHFFHVIKFGTGCQEPQWVSDGEILNTKRFGFSSAEQTTYFTRVTDKPEAFNAAIQYLRASVQKDGFIYKDVIQPFISSAFLANSDFRIVHIKRPVAEVAFHMQRRWEFDREKLLQDLIDGERTLERLRNRTVLDFEDVIFQEDRVSEFIGERVRYIDDAFKRHRDSILELKHSSEFRDLDDQVLSLRNSGGDVPALTQASEAVPLKTSGKSRLMMIAESVVPTGFARVSEAIGGQLVKKYELHQLAIHYDGSPIQNDWPLYPAEKDGKGLLDRVGPVCELVDPDFVLIINDPWVVSDIVLRLRDGGYGGPVLAYVPVDAVPLPRPCAKGLAQATMLIAYTEFGKMALNEHMTAEQTFVPPIAVIPHGVDLSAFYPIVPGDISNSRKFARRKLLPDEPRFQSDAFIVLNANRNQPRKRIDATIAGFAAFAKDKPENVLLYLHLGTHDLGWDVVALAERFGIEDRLVMSTPERNLPHLPEEHLNLVYNACDIGINTSAAEGWGLVSFEHAATGAGQILSDLPVHREIWEGIGELVPADWQMIASQQISDWHLLDPDTVAASLEKVYADTAKRNALSKACHMYVKRPEFSWEAIGKTWISLFEEVLRGVETQRIMR